MASKEFKNWFDLNPEKLKEAVLGLNKENLKETDEHMVRGRVSAFEEGGLISSEEATSLREHLDSLTEKKS